MSRAFKYEGTTSFTFHVLVLVGFCVDSVFLGSNRSPNHLAQQQFTNIETLCMSIVTENLSVASEIDNWSFTEFLWSRLVFLSEVSKSGVECLFCGG